MADRKRDLDQNALAVWISRVLSDYGAQLKVAGAAVVVLLIGYLIFQLMAASEQYHRAKGWEDYLVATSPEDYQQIIEKYKGLRVELWAMLDLADTYYSDALGSLAYDREQAETRLKQALELYRQVASQADRFSDIAHLLKPRALLGAAQCHESLGQRDEALKLYEQVAKQYRDSWAGARAEAKLKELGSSGAAEFYAELRKLKVAAPSLPTSPGSLLPPAPSTSSEGTKTTGESSSEEQNTVPEGDNAQNGKKAATPKSEEKSSESSANQGTGVKDSEEKSSEAPADRPATPPAAAKKDTSP